MIPNTRTYKNPRTFEGARLTMNPKTFVVVLRYGSDPNDPLVVRATDEASMLAAFKRFDEDWKARGFEESIALCRVCRAAIGGAHGGPDAPHRPTEHGERCEAADCQSAGAAR